MLITDAFLYIHYYVDRRFNRHDGRFSKSKHLLIINNFTMFIFTFTASMAERLTN